MTAPSFTDSLNELQAVLEASAALENQVAAAGAAIIHALEQGCKLMTCGNGGSAADAMHLAEELVGRYRHNRRPLAAICLNADPTALTCIGNDFGYEFVFSRGVSALGKSGDVLVGFSTSGNSANIVHAFTAAKTAGVTTVLLSGNDGGKARGIADFAILVPSANTARIQEAHALIFHHWLEMIESKTWG